MFDFHLRSLSVAVVIACTGTIAAAQTDSPAMGASASAKGMAPAAADKTFVNMAAVGGITEVKLGELAASNGQSPAVKEYGKHMVDDHGKANDELASIAKTKGITPSTALDAPHQKVVDKFGAMKGDAFDKAYWQQMLTDHKKTVALFEKEAKSGKDADIKAFAVKTLPTLKMHLEMVQDAMAGKMAKTS